MRGYRPLFIMRERDSQLVSFAILGFKEFLQLINAVDTRD